MIRVATPDDVPVILGLIRELAEYEKALDEVVNTEEELHRHLFGGRPAVYAHVAEHRGEVVGIAVWFLNYSTWTGRHGIYLEDLYISPKVRGYGYGRALLRELARVAEERGYARLDWAVLDWNAPAIGFYESLGARPQDEWTGYRLRGQELKALAADESLAGG